MTRLVYGLKGKNIGVARGIFLLFDLMMACTDVVELPARQDAIPESGLRPDAICPDLTRVRRAMEAMRIHYGSIRGYPWSATECGPQSAAFFKTVCDFTWEIRGHCRASRDALVAYATNKFEDIHAETAFWEIVREVLTGIIVEGL